MKENDKELEKLQEELNKLKEELPDLLLDLRFKLKEESGL